MKKLFMKTTFCLLSALLFFTGIPFLFAENLVIWRLLGTHLHLGMMKGDPTSSTSSSSSSSSSFQSSFPHILALQQELKKQTTSNLIEQLDYANSESARAVILENYLSSSSQLLSTTQMFIEQESRAIEEYIMTINTCESPIKRLNDDFTLAVQQYDFTTAHSLSQQVASLRVCIAENTVYYKEHLLYRDSTLSLQTTLQKRVDYLTTHKANIITYYDMLKPQLLKELYDISQTLEVNFSG